MTAHPCRPSPTEPEDLGVTAAEAMDRMLADLRLRQAAPLLTVDPATGPDRCCVTLLDRGRPGATYEISVSSAADALRWIAHVAPKTWVSKEHLELLAITALQHFGKAVR